MCYFRNPKKWISFLSANKLPHRSRQLSASICAIMIQIKCDLKIKIGSTRATKNFIRNYGTPCG